MTGPPPGEFEIIARFFAPLAARCPGALGLTDDAAVLEVPPGKALVVTTDTLVAGVHFLPDDPPDLIARKALRVNLSDLAAMGARPAGVLLAAAFPAVTDESWLIRFAGGLGADLAAFDTGLLGGDTVATPGPLTLTITALGFVAAGRALRRSGARPGETVYVSGSLGDAALGLEALRGGLAGLDEAARGLLVDRYHLPRPRVELGLRLIGIVGAAMDISDGLCADLCHICRASGLGAVIEAARLPLSPAARRAVEMCPERLAAVLSGGDDYELLFTAPPAAAPALASLADELGLPLTAIGTMIEGGGVKVLAADGSEITVAEGGYRHFPGQE